MRAKEKSVTSCATSQMVTLLQRGTEQSFKSHTGERLLDGQTIAADVLREITMKIIKKKSLFRANRLRLNYGSEMQINSFFQCSKETVEIQPAIDQ